MMMMPAYQKESEKDSERPDPEDYAAARGGWKNTQTQSMGGLVAGLRHIGGLPKERLIARVLVVKGDIRSMLRHWRKAPHPTSASAKLISRNKAGCCGQFNIGKTTRNEREKLK